MTSIVDHGEMPARITDFELACPCHGCGEKRDIVNDLLIAPSWWIELALASGQLSARARAEGIEELRRRGACAR